MRNPLIILLATLMVSCITSTISKDETQFPDNPNHDHDGDGLTELLGDCDDMNPDVIAGPWYADEDNDGFGNPFISTTDCDERIGYVDNNLDCNDQQQSVYPGSNNESGLICVLDLDGDGYGELNPPPPYQPGTDCNDNEPLSSPNAIEICDGIDNDCDGSTDEGDSLGAAVWYLDHDEDGYGDAAIQQTACTQPLGYVTQAGDCDDDLASVYPNATEVCNGIDDNCDTEIDESNAIDATLRFQDFDGDGYGNAGVIVPSCQPLSGYVNNGDDCNDLDSGISPGADEYCDGFDNNCDLQIDEGTAIDAIEYYIDSDGDGYGLAGTGISLCTAISGRTDNAVDCNDSNAAIYPTAPEYCNNIDDDCNSLVDDQAIDKSAYYLDQDQDGYGDSAIIYESCPDFDPISGLPRPPAGHSTVGGDCDDTTAERSPGNFELCTASIDENCDGDPTLGATDLNTYFADTDGDGYGSPLYELRNCTQPPGYVLNQPGISVDCNDNDSEVMPDQPETWELCNGKLDRCEDDDGFLSPPANELDDDDDGYVECTLDVDPLQWNNSAEVIIGGGDCEDTDPLAYPGATEICNGAFEDCSDPYLTLQAAPLLETDNDGDGYVECAGFDSSTWEGELGVIGDLDCNDVGVNAIFAFPGAGGDANTCIQDADGDGESDCVFEGFGPEYGCDLGIFLSETVGVDMVYIEAGTNPIGDFTITRDFYLSTMFVSTTAVRLATEMASNGATDNACVYVGGGSGCKERSWEGRAAQSNVFSDLAGLDRCYEPDGSLNPAFPDIYSCPGYRLPTRAEIEYGLRAGSTANVWTGDGPELGGYADYDSEGEIRIFDGVTNPPALDYFNPGNANGNANGKKPNGNGLYCYLSCNDSYPWAHDNVLDTSGNCPDWSAVDPVCTISWTGRKSIFGTRSRSYFSIDGIRANRFGSLTSYYTGGVGNFPMARTVNP